MTNTQRLTLAKQCADQAVQSALCAVVQASVVLATAPATVR